MTANRFRGLLVLTAFAATACVDPHADIPKTGPAYMLTTKGAAHDVHEVLLRMLQERCKPVRVSDDNSSLELGTIHVQVKVREKRFETEDKSERVGIPRYLRATVTVETTDGGSSNWDGEHKIGFENSGPSGGFSDADEMRRRYTRKLLEVALKQLPDQGKFVHDTRSASAAPGK